jgi:hypothetical protein
MYNAMMRLERARTTTMNHNHTHSHSSHHNHPVPSSGVLYFAKVGNLTLEFAHAKVTGREILVAAKKAPDEYDLYQYLVGGKRIKIDPEDIVDLSAEGIEQFKVIGKKNTDGLMRESAFVLPDREIKVLDSNGLDWSTRKDHQGRNILTIYQYPLPSGYREKVADISFIIPNNFPESQIDMAYFYPALTRADGIDLKAITGETFFGLSWQRWSRHRTPDNPWFPGEDDIGTHLAYVEGWLRSELKRGR